VTERNRFSPSARAGHPGFVAPGRRRTAACAGRRVRAGAPFAAATASMPFLWVVSGLSVDVEIDCVDARLSRGARLSVPRIHAQLDLAEFLHDEAALLTHSFWRHWQAAVAASSKRIAEHMPVGLTFDPTHEDRAADVVHHRLRAQAVCEQPHGEEGVDSVFVANDLKRPALQILQGSRNLPPAVRRRPSVCFAQAATAHSGSLFPNCFHSHLFQFVRRKTSRRFKTRGTYLPGLWLCRTLRMLRDLQQ
jgi:hypothetical protein